MKTVLLLLMVSYLSASCMPRKYDDVPAETLTNGGRTYTVVLKQAEGSDFDVLVANQGVRWRPDELGMRQEFLAVARQRAATHCGNREVQVVDTVKPSADFAGLDTRFRCK